MTVKRSYICWPYYSATYV